MKKLLLILLCLPLLFSCGESDKTKQRNKIIDELVNKHELSKEITIEMQNDGYTGKGTYIIGDHFGYEGEWKDGKPHGQGTCSTAHRKYMGEWRNGKKNGQGIYSGWLRFDGSEDQEYVGEFKDNKMYGKGTWTDNTYGYKYKGEWKDDNFRAQDEKGRTLEKSQWANDDFFE